MMKCILVAVAVLGVLSVGQSAPVSSCENLIQPREINGTDLLLGTWTYIAESTNIPSSKLLTKMFVESSRVKVTASNESDTITLLQSQKSFGRCFTLTYKMTLEKNTLTSAFPLPFSTTMLSTGCSDCHAFFSNFTLGGRTYHSVQLISKRDKVEAAELDEFTKQVECLNLPAPAVLDPEKGFCSDDSPSQDTEVTDMTQVIADMGTEVFGLLDSFLSSQDGINSLIKIISAGVAESKSQ